jgi:hypothetical protein
MYLIKLMKLLIKIVFDIFEANFINNTVVM